MRAIEGRATRRVRARNHVREKFLRVIAVD
jgi:hypothetical protein